MTAFRRFNEAEAQEVAELIERIRGGTTTPLSDWESDFMESIAGQWDEKAWLSDKQLDILHRIEDQKL